MFHLPKVVRGGLPLDVTVHCPLEQDGSQNPLAIEAGAGHNTAAHLMHDRKHLVVVGPRIFLDSGKIPAHWACCHRFGPAPQ